MKTAQAFAHFDKVVESIQNQWCIVNLVFMVFSTTLVTYVRSRDIYRQLDIPDQIIACVTLASPLFPDFTDRITVTTISLRTPRILSYKQGWNGYQF